MRFSFSPAFNPAMFAVTAALLVATPAAAHPGHGPTDNGNMIWLGLAVLALAFGLGLYRGTRASTTRASS